MSILNAAMYICECKIDLLEREANQEERESVCVYVYVHRNVEIFKRQENSKFLFSFLSLFLLVFCFAQSNLLSLVCSCLLLSLCVVHRARQASQGRKRRPGGGRSEATEVNS